MIVVELLKENGKLNSAPVRFGLYGTVVPISAGMSLPSLLPLFAKTKLVRLIPVLRSLPGGRFCYASYHKYTSPGKPVKRCSRKEKARTYEVEHKKKNAHKHTRAANLRHGRMDQ